MSITSIRISCETIARNDKCHLGITVTGEQIAIKYGDKARDLFLVDRGDFVQALRVLGIKV
jgi:hypothetical protein